ncbi:hypothetical protein T265_09657 [Opisthorchis viverrini]|uniref:Uncharacterized protein n=1 Tax=Opisthorchis viverrini TaxID=6198 RepID=A0A075A486_OPIVI|nr:hypothetical protein T265_09657 [Opisthorchis viverrini]KER22189.1 hypothetical protein T265_09657 [Opisthorchis viverrini]
MERPSTKHLVVQKQDEREIQLGYSSSKPMSTTRIGDAPATMAVPTGRTRRGSIFVSALASETLSTSPGMEYSGSMIVRSGRTNVAGNATFTGTSPDQTVAMEGVIVTPFAQVLVSLQRIRHAFIRLTSAQSTHR